MRANVSTSLLLCFALMLASVAASSAGVGDVLGPGDTVRVAVFQNPDLGIEATISAEGTIAFPLLGEVNVGGRTPIEAGRFIADRLRQRKLVLDPQVSVTLVSLRSRQVAVLGQVAKPGNYPLEQGSMHVTDLLALAGGISASGDGKVVVVTNRTGTSKRVEIDVPAMYKTGDLSSNLELVPGDTIFVPSAPVFYIYGAVQRPGMYPLEPGTSVIRALAIGGGLTPRGTERGLKINRRNASGKLVEYSAALTDRVQPDDVIQVKSTVF
jgi:polysaccharide biosynthesis/export protein